MKNWPEEVREIAIEANQKSPEDIAESTASTVAQISELACYKDIISEMIFDAVRGLINDIRHAANCQRKKEAGGYNSTAKVTAASDDINEIHQTLYDLAIAGNILGNVKGCELEGLACSQQAQAIGNLENAELLRRLRPLVKDNKTVRESVKIGRLRQLWREAKEAVKNMNLIVSAAG